MRYRGLLYRAINPVWARTPLSGDGARRHGGRFNPKGTAALYTSTSIPAAIREANQVGTLQPTTLVAYRADLHPVFDAADPAALAQYGLTPEHIAADDWRLRMLAGQPVPTQQLAARLIADGFVGLRVRSFARGSTDADINLVLWTWASPPRARLILVDDEGRLDPPPR